MTFGGGGGPFSNRRRLFPRRRDGDFSDSAATLPDRIDEEFSPFGSSLPRIYGYFSRVTFPDPAPNFLAPRRLFPGRRDGDLDRRRLSWLGVVFSRLFGDFPRIDDFSRFGGGFPRLYGDFSRLSG